MTTADLILKTATGTNEEWITFVEVEKLMNEFAKYKAIEIIKKLSKTEAEYQYNIKYVFPEYNIR